MQVFIASKIDCLEQQKLNEKIYNFCIKEGFQVHVAQIVLPLNTKATPLQILEFNEKAVDDSDIIIVIFDQIDAGTAMELERAYIKNKLILGYRSNNSKKKEYIGKMLQGAWDRIPNNFKTSSLEELKRMINNFGMLLNRTTKIL
jgi:nucleoside 2-deoxyribosyltransferase